MTGGGRWRASGRPLCGDRRRVRVRRRRVSETVGAATDEGMEEGAGGGRRRRDGGLNCDAMNEEEEEGKGGEDV